MIPSLQSRCGRHSCAMQQRVLPRGLIRGSLGLNPPAHPIILTGAKQAAEPRRAAEAQHSQGRPVTVGAGIADKAACNVVDRLGCPVAPGSVHHGTLHYLQFANLGPGIPFLFFIFTPH